VEQKEEKKCVICLFVAGSGFCFEEQVENVDEAHHGRAGPGNVAARRVSSVHVSRSRRRSNALWKVKLFCFLFLRERNDKSLILFMFQVTSDLLL
jgi:hypothetical protein